MTWYYFCMTRYGCQRTGYDSVSFLYDWTVTFSHHPILKRCCNILIGSNTHSVQSECSHVWLWRRGNYRGTLPALPLGEFLDACGSVITSRCNGVSLTRVSILVWALNMSVAWLVSVSLISYGIVCCRDCTGLAKFILISEPCELGSVNASICWFSCRGRSTD